MSKYEESTKFNPATMEYLCNCLSRINLKEIDPKKKKEENEKKLAELMNLLNTTTPTWQNLSEEESQREEERIIADVKEHMIDYFKLFFLCKKMLLPKKI